MSRYKVSRAKKHRYRIDPITNCWNWLLHTNNGYGRISIGRAIKIYAHRFYYEEKLGKIPIGMDIDHLCKNRKCVNPDHMEVVTRKENINRKIGSPKIITINQKDQIVKLFDEGKSQTEIASSFNLLQCDVARIIKNQ